ncbi:unnamed protein product, partial [Brenthis ino]
MSREIGEKSAETPRDSESASISSGPGRTVMTAPARDCLPIELPMGNGRALRNAIGFQMDWGDVFTIHFHLFS